MTNSSEIALLSEEGSAEVQIVADDFLAALVNLADHSAAAHLKGRDLVVSSLYMKVFDTIKDDGLSVKSKVFLKRNLV